MLRCISILIGVTTLTTLTMLPDERPKADAQLQREGDAARRKLLDPLEWKTAPELVVEKWVQGEATTFEKLRGKVVLIDFWGTW